MTRRWLILGVLAAGLAAFFAFRLIMFIFFPPPWTVEQPLQAWMTPGFVARMYDIPPHILDPALQIDNAEGRKITLSEIATRQGISFDELARRIEALAAVRKLIRD
jgi:hypothetical protein